MQKSGSAAEVEAIRQAMSAGEETDQEVLMVSSELVPTDFAKKKSLRMI